MEPVEPIHTVELFPPLSQELILLLKELRRADWARPTICSPWSVKDVAAHLLGGSLGRLWNRDLATTADGDSVEAYAELVDLINRDNELWVRAAQRISPEVLIEFLELTDRQLYEHFKSLGENDPATIGVAWAGNGVSPNWFDIAREYTEKWLHQQHIREAVGSPLLTHRRWLFPVLDTFLRGLPHAYRDHEAGIGAAVTVQITGEAGGEWSLVREQGTWRLFAGRDPQATSSVQIDQDLAWRLFTKGVSRKVARRQVQISGDAALGEQVLEMISIMA
jgi:uncharacterized protein (TIGR03083 family)